MKTARALSEAKTVETFEKSESRRAEHGYTATAEFGAVAKDLLPRLEEHISSRLMEGGLLAPVLRQVSPDKLALAGLDSLFHSVAIGNNKEPGRTIELGRAIHGELWAAGALKTDKKLRNDIAKASGARARASVLRKAGFRSKDWTEEQALRAGNWLLDCCLQALPDVFKKTGNDISLHEEARNVIHEIRERVMWSNPVIVPCTQPPKPWTGLRAGGFWDERTRLSVKFVRTHHKDLDRDIERAFKHGGMRQHVDGVNSLQAVPWRINEPVLGALRRYAEPLRAAGKLRASESLLAEDIATASRLSEAPFYTPMNCDFRGRVFGVPHFNCEREDHVRSLFLFDRGQPITNDRNLGWLLAHTAAVGGFKEVDKSLPQIGMDKESFPNRFHWALSNWDLIERTARLETEAWLEADKPFAFLAACIEAHAARTTGVPGEYITRLPIHFDGTCSGLQHLCAMTRDHRGGELVNLRASSISSLPQDIYRLVADKVAGLTEQDDDLRHIKIDRKLVKRPVMTYGYSSKQFGMKDQLSDELADRNQRLDGRVLWRLAGYVFTAIEETLPVAKNVLTFLRTCANRATSDNEPLQWTTPTGFPWGNRYYEDKTQLVKLLLSGVRIRRTIADGYEPKILSRRAANSVAPNVVHALDAAHLLRTVNACTKAGIEDILAIHDCFACLAPQAEQFNKIIRDEFIAMYFEHDPLTEIRERVLRNSGPMAQQLLPLPERGSLDLSELSKSHYAFS